MVRIPWRSPPGPGPQRLGLHSPASPPPGLEPALPAESVSGGSGRQTLFLGGIAPGELSRLPGWPSTTCAPSIPPWETGFSPWRAAPSRSWTGTGTTSSAGGADAATVAHERDRSRTCPGCGLESFPRLSPAVIVLIARGEELLLSRSPHFPAGVYSVLAGFVEPGETLEEAVEREIAEEVGLQVRNVRYVASQPWPFP